MKRAENVFGIITQSAEEKEAVLCETRTGRSL